MAVIYKTLFDIKVLHQFYFSEQKGETIFDQPAQADRINFIQRKLAAGLPSIDEELVFETPASLRQLYHDQRIRVIPTYSGCKVATEVIAQKLPDDTVVYTPKIPLPPDFTISVLVRKKDPVIDSYTNARINQTVPCSYYFTNENIPGAKTFPRLCGPVAAFDAAREYEQGELVSFGANDIRAFYRDGGGVQWNPITGSGFVNENDRIAITPRFYYHYNTISAITDATFTLTDSGGATVHTYEIQSQRPMKRTLLDLSALPLRIAPGNTADDTLVYTLKTEATDGYTDTVKLIFVNNELNIADYWALIQVKASVANAAFDLFDPLGRLITRRNPDGSRVEAPVFEIPVTSRFTYWRYINDKKGKFNIGDYPSDFLDFSERALVSKTPRHLTRPTMLYKKADNTFHYLPNPQPHELIRIENDRFFTDIIVPKSKLFPVVP